MTKQRIKDLIGTLAFKIGNRTVQGGPPFLAAKKKKIEFVEVTRRIKLSLSWVALAE